MAGRKELSIDFIIIKAAEGENAEENQEYQNTLALLLQVMPELSDCISTTTDEYGRATYTLKTTTEAPRTNTEEWKRNAKAQAYQEYLNTLMEQYNGVMLEAAENEIGLTKARYELEAASQKYNDAIRSVANTADGAYNAAYRWCLKFEIPANTEATSQKRGALARDTYWPKYNGNTGTTADKPTTGEKRATEAARSLDKTLAGTYTVNATSGLHIRNGAGTGKASLAVLPNGTKVRNYGYYTLTGGVKWMYVQATYNSVTYTGFMSSQYLRKQ